MPFDDHGFIHPELKPLPKRGPARVYDKDNPPPTFAEALRMAVKDMAAMFARGIGYCWASGSLAQAKLWGACGPCMAASVLLRLGGDDESNWDAFGPEWEKILISLSSFSAPILQLSRTNLLTAADTWPRGFPPNTPDFHALRDPSEDPCGAIDDMFACADMLDELSRGSA